MVKYRPIAQCEFSRGSPRRNSIQKLFRDDLIIKVFTISYFRALADTLCLMAGRQIKPSKGRWKCHFVSGLFESSHVVICFYIARLLCCCLGAGELYDAGRGHVCAERIQPLPNNLKKKVLWAL